MEQQAKAPPEIKKVAQFLRGGGAGLKVRVGALSGKRVDYFKGKSAVKALLSPAYAKLSNVPKVATEEDAVKVLNTVNMFAFYLRAQRGGPSGTSSSSPKILQIIPEQKFTSDEYYAWFYEGSQWTTYAGGVVMVAVMLAGVMFPLWPSTMRLGVWYLSIVMLGLIGLFFAIAVFRLIFYIITILVASPGIWIFPKLFADVGFIESFIPLWEWDIPKKKSKKKGKKEKGKEKEQDQEQEQEDAVEQHQRNGGAFIEEIPEEAPEFRPTRNRNVLIEEVDDEDA
ncbi:hypothetical protein M378DRAFT_169235 [Amanita muscaria Koide BX008]|uniref:Translocation protein SEC62 n=1 Tax=Amanita muscaria (strain Koide BX008) TaxID=946122 RepID=A0A0C2WDK6_AMAMK|nr:hypothetical protein M378DRAFT_169235 [Amanita muscaria Koide BX008]